MRSSIFDRVKTKWQKKFGNAQYGKLWNEQHDNEWYLKIHNSNYLLHDDFKKFLKSKNDIKTVLEVGCGFGIYPINNNELFSGIEYTGIDISEPAIEYCKKNSSFEFILGDLIKLELDKKYDLVFSHAVVDHVYDIDAFITKIIKHTRKYAYINSYRGYFPSLKEHKMRWDGNYGCYFNDLSVDRLTELLKRIGLSDDEFIIKPQKSGQTEKNLGIQTNIIVTLHG
ncbi:MAG: class I SAM-dependent methyltransferase [Candidatus Nitrosotenuis sp.]